MTKPLQCWVCGKDHRIKYCLCQRENLRSFQNLDRATMVEDMVREIPRIYVALEDQQTYHQSNVIKVEGKIPKKSISIQIDPGFTHSYVMPRFLTTTI